MGALRLTDIQNNVVRDAIIIARKKQIKNVEELNLQLISIGYSKEDINTALFYWASSFGR